VSAAWPGRLARLQVVVWAAFMALGAFLYLRAFGAFRVGAWGDDALYVVLGRSLVGDRGFGLINVPGGVPAPSPYPFGYPLILAPLVALAPGALDVLKLPALLATFVNGALLFWGWRWFSRRSRWWGVAVAGLYLISPTVVSHGLMVMTEAVFTALCLAAMLLAEQIARGRPARWRAPLLGGVLTYATLTRSVGVVMALALALYLLWRMGRKAWRAIGLAAAGGLLLTASLLLVAPVKPANLLPARYLTDRDNSLYLIVRQIGAATGVATPSISPESNPEAARPAPLLVLDRVWRHLSQDLRQAVTSVNGEGREQELARRLHVPWISTFLALLTLALVALGWWVWWARDGMTAFGFGGLLYFAGILLWAWVGARLLYPVIPQLQLCFLIGLETAGRVVSAAGRRRELTADAAGGGIKAVTLSHALALGAVVVLGGLSFYGSFGLTSASRIGDPSARTDWLRSNTPPVAVVMSEQAATDFLYGGRHTVPQPRSLASAADLETYLTGRQVDYVLVGPSSVRAASYEPTYSRSTVMLLPLLAELHAAGRLTEVYSSPRDLITVYRSELR
jgi:hypothetical protein